ncbi:MAG TPA: S8 family serine peptidase [Candidatus Baltobacteraceae bacterium]|nr:S8 family serine peptidase [Candidatus Baltobacteraceae bacterium]
MNRRLSRILAATVLVAITGCSGIQSQRLTPSAGAPLTPGSRAAAIDPLTGELLGPSQGYYPLTQPNALHQVCPRASSTEPIRCFAWMRTDLHPQASGNGIPATAGYTPQDIWAAYHLNPRKGGGQTVAIVDAFGYRAAASDLKAYRRAAGLAPCTISSGCLRILNQNGQSSPLPAQPKTTSVNFGWVYEQALDLDAVSAACPKCKIMLMEASAAGGTSLYTAVASAARLGANVITNSYGGSEKPAGAPCYGSGESSDPAFSAPGHVYVASAGDSGGGLNDCGGPQQPCTLQTVVCVGGTRLTGSGSSWNEVAWNDLAKNQCGGSCGGTGSGCSYYVSKPSWQTDSGCRMRSEADVSADASPFTPFAVYSVNFKRYGSPWSGFGGTSLAAPLVAGIFALAGNAKTRHAAQEIWQARGASLNDVTKGTNVLVRITGACASSAVYICRAGIGFDGPTGWGTPDGTAAF